MFYQKTTVVQQHPPPPPTPHPLPKKNKQKTTHMFLNPGIYRFIGLALEDNFFSMKGFRSDEHAVNSNNASDHA